MWKKMMMKKKIEVKEEAESSTRYRLPAMEDPPEPHPPREAPITEPDYKEKEDPSDELECELCGLQEQAIPKQALLHHQGQLEPAELSGSFELTKGLVHTTSKEKNMAR